MRTVVQGALNELSEGIALDAAGFMMETLLELLELLDRDGGTPARAVLRLIRGGRGSDSSSSSS